MFHVDNNSGVSAMPPVGAVQSSAPRWFTEGGGGTPASYPGAAWYNIIQAELLNLLSAYGVAPDKADLTQLKKAIEAAIADKATAASALLAAIAALNTSADKLPYFNGKDSVAMTDLTQLARTLLGRANAADILSDLGISDNTIPVGIPMPWPLAIPPAGWIKCNGATFTSAQYPKLAAIFTGLQVPDLRGEFIRGWDDGRGVDTGRAMQTPQGDAMRNLDGEVGYVALVGNSHQSGVLTTGGAQNQLMIGTDPGKITTAQSVFFNARNQVPTASEFRPRNISFNYIIRAA